MFGFIAPIILALLINQIAGKRIKGFVQTITYMPHFISTVVIVSMINIFLNPDSGMIGRFCGETNLMGNADAFAPIYWITEVWQHCGWNSIIYLAALAGVDTSLYEAAKMDGAGRLQLIRYVDIPAIMPTCGILLILNMGSVLGVGFEKVYLMQNSLNLSSSEVLSTFVYKMGLVSNQYSYSTAIGLFNTVINFAFLVTANLISKRVSTPVSSDVAGGKEFSNMSASTTAAVAPKTSGEDIPWNPKVRQHKTPGDWVVDIIIVAILVAVVFVTIYPLWFIVIASFSDAGLVSQGEVFLLPKGINFSGYLKILDEPRIWIGYRNTLIYSVVGTLVNMVVTLPVGFALSRVEFKPRRIILFLFTFTMFFSGGLIPSYLLYKQLGPARYDVGVHPSRRRIRVQRDHRAFVLRELDSRGTA